MMHRDPFNVFLLATRETVMKGIGISLAEPCFEKESKKSRMRKREACLGNCHASTIGFLDRIETGSGK